VRICLLSYRGWVYCGGQGVYVYYLSRALQRLGHEVHVIVGPPYPNVELGIGVHQIETSSRYVGDADPSYTSSGSSFSSLLSPISLYERVAARLGVFPEPFTFSLRAYRRLRHLQSQCKFDIIHDNQCLGYGLLLMKRLGIPVIATVHHPLPIDKQAFVEQAANFRERFMWRRLYSFTGMQDRVVRRLDRIIAVSAASAEQTRQTYGIDEDRLRIVYNGVDTDSFSRQDGVEKEPNSLIMVGRTEDRKKGILFLLKALQLLKDEVDVKLTIVDDKPPGVVYAPRLIREYGLDGRVVFTGRINVEELVRRYSAAEVAVVPSVYEGFGFPAAEAMACEVPVIATRGGALPEVVGEDGETGVLVPPQDPHALAGAIKRLLADGELRRRLGKSGRERIVRHFTWEEAARKTLEVYEEVR